MDEKDIKKITPAEKHKIKELEQEIKIKNEYITSLEEQNDKETSRHSPNNGHKALDHGNYANKSRITAAKLTPREDS